VRADRAQEIARYVQQGVLDAGITGTRRTLENRARVKEIADLRAPWPNYNRCAGWCGEGGSKIRRPHRPRGQRIATEWSISPSAIARARRDRAHRVLVGRHRGEAALLADAIVDVRDRLEPAREQPARDRHRLESTPRFIAKREICGRAPARG